VLHGSSFTYTMLCDFATSAAPLCRASGVTMMPPTPFVSVMRKARPPSDSWLSPCVVCRRHSMMRRPPSSVLVAVPSTRQVVPLLPGPVMSAMSKCFRRSCRTARATSSSPVMSYVTVDPATGNTVVVNVTLPGHPLFPGYVAREVCGGVVHNFGEGTSSLQSPSSPFANDINNVWIQQTQNLINNVSK